jgi:ketosteroid isomerase-like protein
MALNKPSNLHANFVEAFNSGDVERILALYELQALVVAPQDRLARGHVAIREVMLGFLAFECSVEMETIYCHEADGIALLRGKWKLAETELHGESIEVARRQPDGRWLFIVDHPFGAA